MNSYEAPTFPLQDKPSNGTHIPREIYSQGEPQQTQSAVMNTGFGAGPGAGAGSPHGSLARGNLPETGSLASRGRFGSANSYDAVRPATGTMHRGGMFPPGVGGGMAQKMEGPSETGTPAHPPLVSEGFKPMNHMTLDDTDERRTLNSTTGLSVVSGSIPFFNNQNLPPPANKTVSALYGLLFTLIGVVLVLSKLFNPYQVRDFYIDLFGIYMFGVGFCMTTYLCLSVLCGKVSPQPIIGEQQMTLLDSSAQSGFANDPTNGNLYTKLAVGLCYTFSLVGIVLTTMEVVLGDRRSCILVVRVALFVLIGLFHLAQLVLVLTSAHNRRITSLTMLARIAASHVIATNVFYWLILYVKETQELILFSSGESSYTAGECSRRYQNIYLASLEEKLSPYIYPFSLGFSMFSSFLIYRMWENIGKKQTPQTFAPLELAVSSFCKPRIKAKELWSGVVFLLLAIISSAGAIFLSTSEEYSPSSIYYLYGSGIIWAGLSLIIFPLATCAIKGFYRNPKGLINWLNRPLIIFTSVPYLIFSIFCAMSSFFVVNSFSENSSTLETISCITFVFHVVNSTEIIVQNVYLAEASRRVFSMKQRENDGSLTRSYESESDEEADRWYEKRSANRIVLFLLFALNFALLVLALVEFANNLTLASLQWNFYGYTNWAIFLYLFGPFSCLYRLHSFFSFLEIWTMVL